MSADTPPPGRLDAELVRRSLARSRGHADDLLECGSVRVNGRSVKKASARVGVDDVIEVHSGGTAWVGRGAAKLDHALTMFDGQALSVAGARCLDAGAGTGGFTQVLLARGAYVVVAVDVGRGQLAQELRDDPRVREMSGCNIRSLTAPDIGGQVDVLVADLSFISLVTVLPTLAGLLCADGDAVLLVKPQFEVGRRQLSRSGVARDTSVGAAAIVSVCTAAVQSGLCPRDMCASPIRGGAGNHEYLVWMRRGPAGTMSITTMTQAAARLTGAEVCDEASR